MYIVVVALTMLILPLASIAIDLGFYPGASSVVFSIGRWFVFWGVGVRLFLAGTRQFLQPTFTAREIFHTRSVANHPRTWIGEFFGWCGGSAFPGDTQLRSSRGDFRSHFLRRGWGSAHRGAQSLAE
jgi:hypothetical protein